MLTSTHATGECAQYDALKTSTTPANLADIPEALEPQDSLTYKQFWLESLEENFRPGLVKVGYSDEHLLIYAKLMDDHIFNNAQKLNDKAWMLGDMFEILLVNPDNQFYWEFQITPENHRLQIQWPMSGPVSIDEEHPLESFFIDRKDVLVSQTEVSDGEWRVCVSIPVSTIAPNATSMIDITSLRMSFCRYDYTSLDQPYVLSSTSSYLEPRFHRLDEFTTVNLSK